MFVWRGRAKGAALSTLLVAAGGCVETNRPDADTCAAPAVELRATLTADTLVPADPAVCRGQQVTLTLSPQVDGAFHIHGYDADLPATEVRGGQELELSFTASRSGQFPVELHTQENPEGASVGIFTVHEP